MECLFVNTSEMMLKKFNMYGCKAVATPLAANEKLMTNDGGSIVGSLMYLMKTRPDIMFASSLLSGFMHA